ncbi:MAG: LysM peptidoglycan-binding domain-containing protein [Proteobacteria bacterium]|nr:LysM peptidoglycan-binding domain-containing protein [Pseudomonadota bacterium]MBU2226393.1 LysM peptidoglycan-binding domain-containing protein [Pseudomonadota bacterium]
MMHISLQTRGHHLCGKGRGRARNVGQSLPVPSVQRLFRFVLIMLAGTLVPLLHPLPLPAREDSARLVFQKKAGIPSIRVHVVKKGEWLAYILRKQYGDEPVSLALIRKLNPKIRNLNRIYPGQRIQLPVREVADLPETADADPMKTATTQAAYRIRNGDSISRIILRELGVSPEEALPTYRLIRQLNPDMEDMARLQAGQTLHLPPGHVPPAPAAAEPLHAAARPAEQIPEKTAVKTPPPAESPLGIIRPVVSRMKGTVIDKGNYYIPLGENAQVTLDCFLIPVVELDDGTTVLIDFGNRLSEDLKGMIRKSWVNYFFLAGEALRDDLAILQGIIKHSRKYRMDKVERPLTLMVKPEIQVFPDWIIAGRQTADAAPYRQGLFLLGGSERPFSPEIRAFAEKNGFIITEIAGGRVIASPVSPAAAPPAIPELKDLKGVVLAERLLSAIGEKPVRNAEVVIFNQALNGFNLSIMADLLLRRGERQFILHTKKLPEQFVRILNEAGTEVILIGEADQGRPLIDSVLKGIDIPVSFGYFSFRIPEEGGRTRFAATLPALKATPGGEPLYLIDFDPPPHSQSLFQGTGGGRVIRY